MIVGAELLAVVRATHQIPLTARVTVMLAYRGKLIKIKYKQTIKTLKSIL